MSNSFSKRERVVEPLGVFSICTPIVDGDRDQLPIAKESKMSVWWFPWSKCRIGGDLHQDPNRGVDAKIRNRT